jgi:iron complex transport system permease protein
MPGSVRRISPAPFYALMIPALLVVGVAGVMIGGTSLPSMTVVKVLALQLLPAGWVDPGSVTGADVAIVWLMRLPRVLVAAIVGAGLATAGVLMQSLFRNPLAEPALTGVGPGAVLGAVTMFVTGWSALLLTGIAVGAFLTALSSLLLSLNVVTWQVAQEIVFWMMGGLDSRTWAHVWLSGPFVVIGTISALAQWRTLDLLLLGEETAAALGVDVAAA